MVVVVDNSDAVAWADCSLAAAKTESSCLVAVLANLNYSVVA